MQCPNELTMAIGIFDDVLDELARLRKAKSNGTGEIWNNKIETNFSEPKYIIKSAYTTDMFNDILDDIDHIIYNEPATIVTFKDGSKVCVKASKGDTFNKETGLIYAIIKRLYANDIDSDTGYFKSRGLGEKINNLVKNAIDQKEIERQEAIIARYRMFNREKSIRAAERSKKRLEKMERLEKPKDEHSIHFRFECRRRTGEDVLMLEHLSKGFDGRTLFRDIRMHLRAGDRVALIGDNGVGKSTLLKCIVGEEKPDDGTIRFGSGVDIGYYDQHQAKLHPEKNVLDEVWGDFRRLDQTEVRGALGMFLFTGDDVLMPVSTLSGGEKGRVALTKLMLRQDNLLLLDEPTNHLDMDSREVLEKALENFPGTILAISHDRYFINRFATRVAVMESEGIREYLGNYDDYFEKINRQQEPDGVDSGMTRTQINREKKKKVAEQKRVKDMKLALQSTEAAIARAEEEAGHMEQALADPATYQDAEKAAMLAKEYQKKKDEIATLYETWETQTMELEAEEA